MDRIGSPARWIAALRFPLGLALCAALGYHLTPVVIATWRDWFPPPEFTVADNRAFFAEAGAGVVLFSDSKCPWCRKVREDLWARGIPFREYFIDLSPEAMRRYVRLGVADAAVPVLLVGERRIVGYREAAIGEALQVAGQVAPTDPR